MTDDAATLADFVVVSGAPDAEELAAVTAVLAGVLDELAAERGRQSHGGQSAWQRTQRSVRGTLTPGAGQWRGFAG
ncbi:acyl-CoA carboxylase epsilon subunit [Galbitalea soli]|uniref:Acyl-CoA carboxylase subunit epsilon n=1 Tax=Galbitalea soli TaxID=1268042 RepID=A0A7C9TQI0_9MICO|nr:acyl-CoA carboxylase subunit epsilon [Galbitalea soli]NYJ30008.1 hypothetical protein [Galbitalea soli]